MARVKIGNVFPSLAWLMERCAPAGFGLGNRSGKSVLWSQIDSAKDFGLWSIWGDEGAKQIGNYAFNYAKMLVIPLDDNTVTQMLFPVGTDGMMLVRNCESGMWQDWEWIDPPMAVGVEYRTVDRFMAKPVYTQIVVADEVPNYTAVRKGETVNADGVDYVQVWYIKS